MGSSTIYKSINGFHRFVSTYGSNGKHFLDESMLKRYIINIDQVIYVKSYGKYELKKTVDEKTIFEPINVYVIITTKDSIYISEEEFDKLFDFDDNIVFIH